MKNKIASKLSLMIFRAPIAIPDFFSMTRVTRPPKPKAMDRLVMKSVENKMFSYVLLFIYSLDWITGKYPNFRGIKDKK